MVYLLSEVFAWFLFVLVLSDYYVRGASILVSAWGRCLLLLVLLQSGQYFGFDV